MKHEQYAAALLGAAIREVFPKSSYLGSGVSEEGFYARFRDTEPFQEGFLSLLINAMKKLEDEQIEEKEMLASNSAELFAHYGEKNLAQLAREIEGTALIIQIGSYYDFGGPAEPTKFYSLLGFEQNGKEVTIFGAAFSTQKEQKEFLKLFQKYPKRKASAVAEQLELYQNGFWHPRGIRLKHLLQEMWRKHLASFGFEEVGKADPKEYFELSRRTKFGYLDSEKDKIFCFEPDSMQLCLQIIQKWVIIFDLRTRIAKGGKRQTLQIADGLGRFRSGPYLEKGKDKVSFSLFGDLDRFIDLVLERTKGDLPFWLCPEQVRLLPMEHVDFDPVIKILQMLKIRYIVDQKKDPLKEKMHRALQVKVPYVIVFGKHEENSGKVKLRAYGSNQDQEVTLEELKNTLAERQLENQ